jgi:hypothetical protein
MTSNALSGVISLQFGPNHRGLINLVHRLHTNLQDSAKAAFHHTVSQEILALDNLCTVHHFVSDPHAIGLRAGAAGALLVRLSTSILPVPRRGRRWEDRRGPDNEHNR